MTGGTQTEEESQETKRGPLEQKPMPTMERRPLSVKPPGEFSFEPADWEKWRKRFERFMILSGNEAGSDADKINCLLYCMGDRAEDVIKRFPATQSYEETLKGLDEIFTPRKNIIYERYRFNTRKQGEDESIDIFITDLFKLAETCDYGTLREELIRDRIIVGMRDKTTSERLLQRQKLNLSEVIQATKQAELQAEDNKVLLGREVKDINRMKFKEQSIKQQEKCWFCGYERHPRDKCPAVKAKCKSCGRIGHFAKLCRSKSMKRLEEEVNKEQEEEVLYKVSLSDNKDKYRVQVKMFHNDSYIDQGTFLIDTGADVTAVPENRVTMNLPLMKSGASICGPDGNKLNVRGTVDLKLSYKGRTYDGKVYVIRGLKSAILGRPSLESMKIISINSMQDTTSIKSEVKVDKEFPNIFNELGVFKDEYSIKLRDDSQTFIQAAPRHISIPLLPKVKAELDRLESIGIISPIEEPTDFVSPIVVVLKNDKVRICGDYTKVNKNILRPIYPIPKIENTLARLKGAKYFSKIDATSGFHQIKLSAESRKLTTIVTPFGRYIYNRLPFGLNCAPEYFSMKFSSLFKDLNILIHMDDILIHAGSMKEHDCILREVLSRLEKEGITINKSKCTFGVTEITFLGHVVNQEGIKPDPHRVQAITQFKSPSNKKELLQFLGMVNFVGRFIPNKSNILSPLHELLKENNLYIWGPAQEEAFKIIKIKLKSAPQLAHYDPDSKVIVSADSSSYGLGAALMQIDRSGKRTIVAYGSRTLSETEKNYAQIEKECLALYWAAEKFKEYITGIHIILESDHKPLVQILQTKPMDELSPRLLRFRLKLMRFDYEVQYTPGKQLSVADALFRQPLPDTGSDMEKGLTIRTLINDNISDDYLIKICSEQKLCIKCNRLKEYTINGWPRTNKIESELKQYYQYRYNFSIESGILLYNSRIVIPDKLQKEILNKIHEGHQGISKCRQRAKQAVWWLGLSKQIEDLVKSCAKCIQTYRNQKEQMIIEEIPERPWKKIGIDLFKFNSNWYLVMMDYYSRFLEIEKLKDLTENSVIIKCKEAFARYGIPEIVRSDCGTQFKTKFMDFAREYGFKSVTSSPYYSQSNGLAESGVKIAKSLLTKNEDIFAALLIYRNTPLESGFSPAELMLGRKLRDNLPMLPSKLKDMAGLGEKHREYMSGKKSRDAVNYNRRHRAKDLKELIEGDRVWVMDLKTYGIIISKCKQPRSYVIKTDRGSFRRNRWHLVSAPLPEPFEGSTSMPQTSSEKEESDVEPHSQNENVYYDCYSSTDSLDAPIEPTDSALQTEVNPGQDSSHSEVRLSKRSVRRPGYLNDYICD
jgi:hypothetical protein